MERGVLRVRGARGGSMSGVLRFAPDTLQLSRVEDHPWRSSTGGDRREVSLLPLGSLALGFRGALLGLRLVALATLFALLLEDVVQVVLPAGPGEVLSLLGHGDEADAHLVGGRLAPLHL